MRIWSILLIKSDLKWCIHLSRSLFFIFQKIGLLSYVKKRHVIHTLIYIQDTTVLLPLAIQIESYLSFYKYLPVNLSPFTCAYYLQFLCYHRMHQYDNRDHALQQLIELVNNKEQCGEPYTSWIIAGHCLLLAGRTVQARHMFYRS